MADTTEPKIKMVEREWKDARTHREPAWPLMGFAPGGYMFRCNECLGDFMGGDKRAIHCLPCAIDLANRRAKQVVEELRFIRSQLNTVKNAIRIVGEIGDD